MSIDVKRLLYSYPKLQVSLQNIRDSIKREQSNKQYPSCTPRYSDDIQGKGGLVSSQTERFALLNVELDETIQYLLWDQEEHEYVLGLIESALGTLNDKQQQLIRLHYFKAREHVNVAMEMNNARMTQYYHWHKTAIDGIEQCLNSGRVFKNRLIPTKKVRNCKKNGVLTGIGML